MTPTTAVPAPTTPAPAPAFSAWLDEFFASYYRHRPINATFIGMHADDDRLPDLSEAGLAALLGDAEALLASLRALPTETLSATERLDRQLAAGFLEIQRWEAHSAHFGTRNPSLYTGEAIFGVLSLLLRPFAPLEQRLEMATARLAAIPAFLDSAIHWLQPAPAAWIERARRECTGARLLCGDGIPLLASDVEPDATRAATRAASDAFASFDAFLERELLPHATDDYACGPEAFDLMLRKAHFLATNADDIERQALERLSTSPSEVPSSDSPADSLARCAQLSNAARDLAETHDLLTFPDWPVQYVDQPEWVRTAAPYLYFLPYRSPAPLDDTPTVDYFVPRGSDETTIKLNHVVHHGSLGHHVQNWFAARAASRIGRVAAVDCASRIAMLCGGTMTEGWACYATDLAEEAGFLTPDESRAQEVARQRMAARAVVDVRLHDGRFSLADATAFYQERVGMPPNAARAEAVKNSLFPGAACMYLVGWDGIWRLRRELELRLGDGFSLRAFHDRLLSFGSVPVSLLAPAMLETSQVPALAHL